MKDLSKTHKKHFKHFSPNEKETVENTIKAIKPNEYKLRSHAIDKLKERGGNINNVFEALKDFNIIEFHAMTGEPRLLIRSKTAFHSDNICIVVATKTKEIVTAYFNDIKDNHFTLDMTKYTKSIDILKFI